MNIDDLIKQYKELKEKRMKESMEQTKHFIGGTGELIADDRWENRSAEMRCHSCMHYVSKIDDKGRCRRHAPTLGGWPVVFETDWCGDHKLS